MHFGLGKVGVIDSVEVLWPSGVVERFSGVAADRIYSLVEGRGFGGRQRWRRDSEIRQSGGRRSQVEATAAATSTSKAPT